MTFFRENINSFVEIITTYLPVIGYMLILFGRVVLYCKLCYVLLHFWLRRTQ